jgi:hypothetical protein
VSLHAFGVSCTFCLNAWAFIVSGHLARRCQGRSQARGYETDQRAGYTSGY